MVNTELSILEAEIAAARGEYEKAVELYRELIPKLERASRPLMVYFLGRVYLKAGMPDEAVGATTGILDENPNHPFILMTLIKAYGELGQTEARREALVRLLDVYKDADEDYVWYTWARAELGKIDIQL
jgi:tetratricopeptide (TPR) repeat protein